MVECAVIFGGYNNGRKNVVSNANKVSDGFLLFLQRFHNDNDDDKLLQTSLVVGVSHEFRWSCWCAFFSLSLSLFLVSGVLCSLSRAHHLLDTCNKQATLPESCDSQGKVLRGCVRALFPHRFVKQS